MLLKNQTGINADEAVLKISGEVTAGQTDRGRFRGLQLRTTLLSVHRNETEAKKASGASIRTGVDVTTHTQLLRMPFYSLPPSTEEQACSS